MENRTKALYKRVFQKAKELIPNCTIRFITTDFEIAAIQALQDVFVQPAELSASIKCCYFHLQQSLFRKVQNIWAQSLYNSDSRFAINCRVLAALAFVPLEKVSEEFENAVRSVESDLEFFDQLANYFQSTYIGSLVGGRQLGAMFPPSLWNLYQSVIDGADRTNNLVEGYHNHLNTLVGSSHPTFGRFIPALRSDIEYSVVKVEQNISGHTPEPRRKKYTDLNERIKRIVMTYNPEGLNFEYLKQIASIFVWCHYCIWDFENKF